jgi:methylmalonyl-CoA mutase
MSDNAAGTELFHLSADFAAVPTADWEALIRKDLKGADYNKKLVWRSEEGIAVQPYYRREALEPLGDLAQLAPGQFPFTRGSGQLDREAQSYIPPRSAIRGDWLHEAGANAAQELAFALAEAVEKLAHALESGEAVDAAARATIFVYAIGSNYFLEIAKFRAARSLWANAVAAFEPVDPACSMAHIHARTARANKSVLDPYTNLLRVTTESMAALLGGCDSLTVEPFGFDPHLANNVPRILCEEARLTQVADPAGGCYYLETLSDALAQQAWQLFQEVEAAGGWSVAIKNGLIIRTLAASLAEQAKAIAFRRLTLLGVNQFPDAGEKEVSVEPLPPLESDPFPQIRLAEPFEAIRRRTAEHAKKTGRTPLVLLLKRGELKMKTARANFSLNFFGCAGFNIAESEEYLDSNADLIVLCSSDGEYLPLAQEVCAAVKVPVVVAGNPKDQIAQLQAFGVQGFVHIASNAVEILTAWQDRLGVAK